MNLFMSKHYDTSADLEKLNRKIMACAFCREHARGKIVPGEGSSNSRLFLVGEAPGKQEAEIGRPFIGRAGKLLRAALDDAKISDSEAFITSAVKYLPRGYITPKLADIEHGRTHLFGQIEIIKPKVIVLMGATAVKAVLDQKFFPSKEHGTVMQENHHTFFLTYHPASALYDHKLLKIIQKDFRKLRRLIENAK